MSVCSSKGCKRPPLEDNNRCEHHRDLHREYNRRHAAQLRELRHDNGLCADCGKVECVTYRCASCAEIRKLRESGISVSRDASVPEGSPHPTPASSAA